MEEKILCSAIKIEGVSEVYDSVYLGLRHGDCFGLIARTRNLLGDGDDMRIKCKQNATQGFLTTKNRFVDRVEGMKIAKENNQIIREYGSGDELYSECLY